MDTETDKECGYGATENTPLVSAPPREDTPPVTRVKITGGLLLAIFLCGFGSVHRGFSVTEFNPVEHDIKEYLNESFVGYDGEFLEDSRRVATLWSILVGIRYVGQIVACLTISPCADRIGRKNTIILLGIGSSILSMLQNLAVYLDSYPLLLVGRIFDGYGDGVIAMIIPLHLNEIAPTQIRGGITTIHSLLVSLGWWIPSILSMDSIFGSEGKWQWMIVVNTAITLPLLFLLVQPEGAKFQYQTNKPEEKIENAIKYYEGENTDLPSKLIELKKQGNTQRRNPLFNFYNLIINKDLRNNLFLTIALALLMCFSGIGAVTNYLTGLLHLAGISDDQAKWCFLGISVSRTCVAVTLVFIIDRVGRRRLILGASYAICVVIVLFCVTEAVEHHGIHGKSRHRYPLIMLKVVLLSLWPVLIGGLNAAVPMANMECFAQTSRASAGAAFFLISYAANYAISTAFPFIIIQLGLFSVAVFVPLLIVPALYLHWKLPETANRESSDIQAEINPTSYNPI